MQQTTPYSLVGTVVVGAVLAPSVSIDGNVATLSGLEGPYFDDVFLGRMIQHHQCGVQLAQLGAQYAQSDEVRHFAVEITVTQLKEIHELETLRTGNAGPPSNPAGDQKTTKAAQRAVVPNPPPAVPRLIEISSEADSPEHRRNRDTLARLAAAGPQFDGMFLQEATAQYTTGLELAELAGKKGSARAIKELAGTLARAQANELAEIKRLQTTVSR